MFRAIKSKLPEYLKNGAIVVDVRSPEEYSSGHIEGSINIPLQELAAKATQLNKEKTILLCCASGTRSGMATTLLKGKGFSNVLNAGPWSNLL